MLPPDRVEERRQKLKALDPEYQRAKLLLGEKSETERRIAALARIEAITRVPITQENAPLLLGRVLEVLETVNAPAKIVAQYEREQREYLKAVGADPQASS